MSIAKTDRFLVDGYNLAPYMKSFNPSAQTDELDATVLTSTFRKYELGFKSARLTAHAVFDNDATNTDRSHDVFSAAYSSGAAKVLTAGLQFYAVGGDVLLLDACEVKYAIPLTLGDLIFADPEFRSTNGLAFAKWLVSSQLNAGTTNGTDVDNGGATTNGGLLHAHLENTSATGVSVRVQHSTNGSVWVDLVEADFGTRASGGYTFALNPTATDTIIFNGVTFTFIAGASTATDVQIKGSLSLTMIEAAAVLNASVNASVSVATYTATATGITVSYDAPGTGGNAYTLGTANGGNSTRTGAILSGGANADAAIHQALSETVAPGTTVNRHLRAVGIVSGGNTVLLSAAFARRY